MADAICARLGRADIPIAAGADQPLYANHYWQHNPVRPWPGKDLLKPARTYQPNQALELLRRVIREHPNEVTLITIGQFTNLALLLLVDPEAVGLLQAVVSMGGAMDYPPDRPVGECNVILDPVAAGICFQRLAEQLTLVPIEPARGKPLEAAQLERIFADETMDGVRAACGGWNETKGKDHVGLADPLTVAMVFDAGLVTTETGRIRLRLFDHRLPDGAPFDHDEVTAATAFEPHPDGPHRVVRAADQDQVHEHLLAVLGAGRSPAGGRP
jgi:purine nucleosidase